MNDDRAALEPESDAEAGAYIEDDPVAWEAFCAALYRYHEYIPALKERVGEDAIKIVAGSMLAFMADEHQTFVWARPRAIAADWARSEGPGLDALHPFDYPNLGFAEIREGLDPTYGDRHPFPETRSPREPAPARSAPSLDEGLLGKAVVAHRMKFWASEPCVENCGPDIAAEYSRLAQEGEIP